ncbi:PilN domain-containing protein [Saccharococcus thermophilus]|uniref:Type IV pilus assembly protein PilN n=1 Tax=Saccharococcus thermophilus TaxID=29396 RepID=A0A846MJ08_9BACL|nr:PilN domain-containing protein [Saccharococcus thermophilus]NIK15603.1 type IV pilus assembly protein PilN [Saccharococcus thermophilus]
MIIEINLLPKKEPKNMAVMVSVAVFALLLIAAAIIFYLLAARADEQINALTGELKQIRAMQAIEQQKQKDAQSMQEIKELHEAVQWSKKYPLKMVPLLRNMTKLLPERGFVMNFSYADNGTVTVAVQFDTSEQAAYYLKRLEDAKFVKDVQLKSVSAVNITETNAEEGTEQQVVPRYLAQYEMHIRKQALTEKEKQG